MFMAGIAAHELDAPPALQPPHPPAVASLVLTEEIATIARGTAMNFNMELSPLNRPDNPGSSVNGDGQRIGGLLSNRKNFACATLRNASRTDGRTQLCVKRKRSLKSRAQRRQSTKTRTMRAGRRTLAQSVVVGIKSRGSGAQSRDRSGVRYRSAPRAWRWSEVRPKKG